VIIRDSGPNEKRLGKLEHEIEAMDDLVDQLLAGARLDFDLERAEHVDLVEIAVTAAERVGKPELLDVAEDVAAAKVRGDAGLLKRAVSNLIQNAETHGSGLTRLAVEVGNGHVIFRVEDDGDGIDDEHAAFAAFQQGDGLESGLGLGLALVKRIAAAHEGCVLLEPSEIGARVVLRLPIKTDA
jgi:signal transduction histidine kinase